MTFEQENHAAMAANLEALENAIGEAVEAVDRLEDPEVFNLLLRAAGLCRLVAVYRERLAAGQPPAEKPPVFFGRRALAKIEAAVGRPPTVEDLDAVRSGAIRVP